jgi:uncharacterized protein YecE (DUF72 family)
MAHLWIGTSGWIYKHWQGRFYPPELPAHAHLAYYAARFPSVEVNYSFYRLPERSVFAAWRSQTPQGFVFAVKGSRYLTHMTKLKDPQEPLARLMERAAGLEEKLGPLLFQLPPTWPLNLSRLDGFRAALAPYAPQRVALECRHQSWLAPPVFTRLERAGIALCLPISPTVPLAVRLTAPWTYLRFHAGQHGIGFSPEELQDWAGRIHGFVSQGAAVYVYFNNDPDGHVLRNAASLEVLLAGA